MTGAEQSPAVQHMHFLTYKLLNEPQLSEAFKRAMVPTVVQNLMFLFQFWKNERCLAYRKRYVFNLSKGPCCAHEVGKWVWKVVNMFGTVYFTIFYIVYVGCFQFQLSDIEFKKYQ